ncbi:DUF305 domain-containing protein [Salinifilum aidingensis]
MHSRTRLPLIAALAAAALLGASCTNADAPPAPERSSAQQSAASPADVTFARGMVPHHEQAVEMADLVPARSDDPAMTDLAERIRQAQQPEIDQLESWLAAWGGSESTADPSGQEHQRGSDGSAGAHDEGHGAGMMSEADMAELERASGTAFDRMWLEMMIEHHRGAVDMAEAELAGGTHPGARKMARSIIDGQRAEIDEMRGMLDAG